MNSARLAVLGIALVAGAGAAYMMSGGEPPPPPAPVAVAPQPPPLPTVEVLVAAADLPMGQTLKAPDMRWQTWPADAAQGGFLRRADAPKALDETVGAIARQSFLAGEPIRREKLVKTDGSGFMSAILPSGMRAMAVAIDTRGTTSAGGFILPNDRVDLVRTFRDEEASRTGGTEAQVVETVLTNVRVLAIGQTVQERNGEKVVTGETATLELTPTQVETVTLAQRVGQLSLALRSLADANRSEDARPVAEGGNVTIVRYGVSQQVSRK
jgi:pilus assembly protein CpaB